VRRPNPTDRPTVVYGVCCFVGSSARRLADESRSRWSRPNSAASVVPRTRASVCDPTVFYPPPTCPCRYIVRRTSSSNGPCREGPAQHRDLVRAPVSRACPPPPTLPLLPSLHSGGTDRRYRVRELEINADDTQRLIKRVVSYRIVRKTRKRRRRRGLADHTRLTGVIVLPREREREREREGSRIYSSWAHLSRATHTYVQI